MWRSRLGVLCLASAFVFVGTQDFLMPDVTLVASPPKGFKAYFADVPGIKRFAFHGAINTILEDGVPGQFSGDVSKPVNGYWIYSNPTIRVNPGDEISYWIYIQYQSRGFKKHGMTWKVPDTPGIQKFQFHGNLNTKLVNVDKGQFHGEVDKPQNGFWVYSNPDLQLKVGDVIHYWVFIHHNRLGYRKEDLKWEVKELITDKPLECTPSQTITSTGATVCKGSLILDDDFDTLDPGNWIVQKYIPKFNPDLEFNTYENDNAIVSVQNSRLQIRPIPKPSQQDPRETLDLTEGCTSPIQSECSHQFSPRWPLPPVRSGKILSKLAFRYGKLEIRAKLPEGDWIFPEVRLVPVNKKNRETKVWVAYARGNDNLQGNDGGDIGGRLLFSGPVLNSTEPARSRNLVSKRNGSPYTADFHTYSIEWQPGEIKSFVDNDLVGTVSTRTGFEDLNTEFNIELGVGVGGNNDFPDNFKSGSNVKPWKNKNLNQIRDFLAAKDTWFPTWKNDRCSLLVESVKLYAI